MTYARTGILKDLGFKSYRDYLRSDLWHEIRARRMCATPVCAKCGKKAQQVHHADYRRATLKGDNPTALICLCRKCHDKAHETVNGRPRYSAAMATEWLLLGAVGTSGAYHGTRKKRRKKGRKRKFLPRPDIDPKQRERDEARLAAINAGRTK